MGCRCWDRVGGRVGEFLISLSFSLHQSPGLQDLITVCPEVAQKGTGNGNSSEPVTEPGPCPLKPAVSLLHMQLWPRSTASGQPQWPARSKGTLCLPSHSRAVKGR